MLQPEVPICHTCGEQVSFDANGEAFVACHECNFPICKDCFHFEIKEGRKVCLRCGTPYAGMPLLCSLSVHTYFIYAVHFLCNYM